MGCIGANSDFPFSALITRPDTAILTKRAAERFGVDSGDFLAINVGSRRVPLEVIGTLDASQDTPALTGTELLVVDISTAQEVLDMAGRLSRIDILLDSAEATTALEAWLSPGLNLVSAAAKNASAASLTGAFYTNLQALSLMALLVGVFLIYNSQSFLVVRRRQHFGILRSMGVTRNELTLLILAEALVLGVLGTIAGLLMGYVLANELVTMVTRTINDLYSPVAQGRLTPDGLLIAKALLLGLGGSLVAGLVPAYEAGRVEPRAVLSRSPSGGWRQGGVTAGNDGGRIGCCTRCRGACGTGPVGGGGFHRTISGDYRKCLDDSAGRSFPRPESWQAQAGRLEYRCPPRGAGCRRITESHRSCRCGPDGGRSHHRWHRHHGGELPGLGGELGSNSSCRQTIT